MNPIKVITDGWEAMERKVEGLMARAGEDDSRLDAKFEALMARLAVVQGNVDAVNRRLDAVGADLGTKARTVSDKVDSYLGSHILPTKDGLESVKATLRQLDATVNGMSQRVLQMDDDLAIVKGKIYSLTNG